jgi:hypothetical protein
MVEMCGDILYTYHSTEFLLWLARKFKRDEMDDLYEEISIPNPTNNISDISLLHRGLLKISGLHLDHLP